GVVVGSSNISGSIYHAFLYSSGNLLDLNDLIDPASGWLIRIAYDINESGSIAAYGRQSNGDYHALLLNVIPSSSTSIPEPAPLMLIGTGFLGLLHLRRFKYNGMRCGGNC
ncbi:PEP-CTERM sorting domain-containing protein, partial [Plasticicumulans sp.]